MAGNNLGLPNNIYSGGTFALPQSFAQYYLQTQARNQARDEALSRYFMDFTKNINPAGVRTQDLPAYMDKVSDMKKFYITNQAAIKNPQQDKGQAYSEYMSRYQDAMNHIQTSKNAAQNEAQLLPIIRDPAKRALLADGTLQHAAQAQLPVNDPNYSPIDYNDIAYNPKPFGALDISKAQGILKNIQGTHSNEIISDVKNPTNPSKNIVTYGVKFNQDQLNSIKQLGSMYYNQHPGFKDMIDKEAADPNNTNYKQLNEVYKKQYGTDITEPEEMATAHMLLLHPGTTYQVEKSNVVPRPRVGRSGSGATTSELWVKGAANAWRGGNKQAIDNYLNKFFGGNTGNKYVSSDTLPNGNVVIRYKGDRQSGTHTFHNQDLTLELDPADPALESKLLGAYQQFMGSDAKTEKVLTNDIPETPKVATPAAKKAFVLPKGFTP